MATTASTPAQKRDEQLYGAPLDSVLRTAAPRAREIAASYTSDEIALFSIAELLWPTLIQSIWCLVPNGGIIKRDDYQWLEILEGYFSFRHGYDARQFKWVSDRECIDRLLDDMAAAEAGKRFKRNCNRKPRRRTLPSERALTTKESEALQAYGECGANKAAAARLLGKDRTTVAEQIENGLAKLGRKSKKEFLRKATRFPTDQRGQENIPARPEPDSEE